MKSAITSELDKVLLALGFSRSNLVWKRQVGELIDVVDLQVSSYRSDVTLNVGVLDPEVDEIVWGENAPEFKGAVNGTVYTRVGKLMDGLDQWWSVHDEAAPQEIAGVMVRSVLPFFDRMHLPGEMERYLAGEVVAHKKYPPWNQVLHLAILMHRRGDSLGACTLLADYRSYQSQKDLMSEGLAHKLGRVGIALGCTEGIA